MKRIFVVALLFLLAFVALAHADTNLRPAEILPEDPSDAEDYDDGFPVEASAVTKMEVVLDELSDIGMDTSVQEQVQELKKMVMEAMNP